VSKIVVFGAGGKAGRLITDEAARWGRRRRWTIIAATPTGVFPGHTFLHRRSISRPVSAQASIAPGSTIPLRMRRGGPAYPTRISPSPLIDEVEQRKFINKRFTVGY